MEKMYKLKYKGKWMKTWRQLAFNMYSLVNDESEVEPMRLTKAKAVKALTSDDNNLEFDEIELVEVSVD